MDTRRGEYAMVPWRIILGVVLGAILVKESRRVGRAYDGLREKLVASLDKFRGKHEEGDAATDDSGSDPSVSPASN